MSVLFAGLLFVLLWQDYFKPFILLLQKDSNYILYTFVILAAIVIGLIKVIVNNLQIKIE